MRRLPLTGALALVLAGSLGWELLSPADEPADDRALAPGRGDPVGVAGDLAPSQTGLSPTGPLADVGNTLLARPLFSPDRRLAMAPAGSPVAVRDTPRLTGIIIGPSGARAVFEDGTGARVVAQGDRLGRFKVGAISNGMVTLIASDGAHVVRPRFANAPEPAEVPIATADGRPR